MSNKIDNRVIVALGFVAVLALIAKPVWDAREQWQFGEGRDDAVYIVTAKSMASGGGYRQENLPGRPYLTKYPPLFPLLMSVAWKITPDFPRTLQTASILQACLLPIYLALLFAVLRQLGFSWRRTFLVAAMTYVSFRFVLLAVTLFSELLFGCFLLAAVFLIERSAESNSFKFALLGGALAGLAYLTRNAAVPLFAAAPIFFVLRKRPRLIAAFFATALPMAAAWHLWGFLHPLANGVRTPYLAEFRSMMQGQNLATHFLEQVTVLSAGTAESFFPGLMGFLRGIPVYHPILIASVVGAIRLGRKRHWPVLLIFAALYLIMIVLWTFEGLDRLAVPVWPVLVAGIAEEASHLANLFAKSMKKFKQVPRWALIAAGVLLVVRNDTETRRHLDSVIAAERDLRLQDIRAYKWIAENADADTVALAWKDGLLYLYSGVPCSHDLFVGRIPEAESIAGRRVPFTPPPAKRALVVLLASDLGGETSDGRQNSLLAAAARVNGSTLEYSAPGAYVYRIPLP